MLMYKEFWSRTRAGVIGDQC